MSGGATPPPKRLTVVALLFSFIKFHECLKFPVFVHIPILKQQCKKLWIVSEFDVMRIFWCGIFFFLVFSKGGE